MNEKKKGTRISFKHIFIAYGVASVIALSIVSMYDKQHAKSAKHSTSQATINTSTPTKASATIVLRKLSTQIVSWQLSESSAEQQTMDVFQKYYAITKPATSTASATAITWSNIHNNLLSADQYAKSKNFTLLQSAWQGIGQEVSSLPQ